MILKNAAAAILEELQDRYDGATDSRTLWMGCHISALEAGLRSDPTADLLEACKVALAFIEDGKNPAAGCIAAPTGDIATAQVLRAAILKTEGRTPAEQAEDDHLRDMIRGRIDHA